MILNSSTHKKYRIARLLLWVTLVSNLLCLQAVSQAAQWTTETIDDPRYYFNMIAPFATGRKLAIPSDGSLNILYGTMNGDLLLAKKEPSIGPWQYLSIFKANIASTAQFPSFAIDAQSRPHVTYTERFNTGEMNIQSAVFDNNTWQVETVVNDVYTNCIWAGSIAVDVSAKEHILYSASESQDASCRLLKYTHKNGDQWIDETIEKNDFVSVLPSAIVLDSNSSPHVIYIASNGTNYELKYAVKKGGVWQISVVTTDINMFPATTVVLDSNDRPHLTYSTAYPNYELKYAFYDGSGWHIQDVGVRAWDSSLALDTNARPHVSYRGVNNSGLFYTFYDGANWQTTTIDTGDYIVFNSIAIDPQGNIHISYVGEYEAMLHAFYDGQAWQIEKVDIWRAVAGESIALDIWGKPHISYSYGSSEIQYAYHDGVNWQIQTIYTGKHGEYGTYTSLALDLQNHPHVIFYDWDKMELIYGVNAGAGWSFSTVNSIGNAYSLPLSMAIDTNSIPHIAYFDEANTLIKYSTLKNNIWIEESINLPFVPTQGFYFLSLLFDSLSQPHILYRIDTSLYYLFKTEAGWQTELVSNKANSWTNGFALDKSSKPFVTFAYQYSGTNDFWYGYRDDTGWYFEEIGVPGTNRGYASSLIFDAMDRPHISYSYNDYDRNEFFLKHAYHDGDAWQIDVVKSATSQFSIDSIVSRTGKLHISYSDSSKRSLEYATASFPYPKSKFPWWSFWPAIMKAAQDRAKQ